MKTLQQLIDELCPNGVEYKKLGEMSIMKRGSSATKKTLIQGNVPVISGGMQPAFYCDRSNRDSDVVTIAGSGASAGYVMFWNPPVFVCDAFSVQGVDGLSDTKFLYYLLKNAEERIQGTQKGGGVPHVHISSIEDFEFPVPPMAVQERIVEILDKFTALTAELQAELQARQQQYEYYRNRLLSFGGPDNIHSMDTDEVDRAAHGSADERNITPPHWKLLKMSEIGTVMRGVSFQKKDFTQNGYPCIHYGQIYTQYGFSANEAISKISENFLKIDKLAHKGDLIMATTSENLEDVGKSVVWEGDQEVIVSNDACIFRHNQNPRYIGYLIQSKMFLDFKIRGNCSGTKVIRMNPDTFLNFEAPIPPLDEQQRIADILDRFEALTNDLQSGLPAEIELRQKQYEYYRNKLLSFDRLPA